MRDGKWRLQNEISEEERLDYLFPCTSTRGLSVLERIILNYLISTNQHGGAHLFKI